MEDLRALLVWPGGSKYRPLWIPKRDCHTPKWKDSVKSYTQYRCTQAVRTVHDREEAAGKNSATEKLGLWTKDIWQLAETYLRVSRACDDVISRGHEYNLSASADALEIVTIGQNINYTWKRATIS